MFCFQACDQFTGPDFDIFWGTMSIVLDLPCLRVNGMQSHLAVRDTRTLVLLSCLRSPPSIHPSTMSSTSDDDTVEIIIVLNDWSRSCYKCCSRQILSARISEESEASPRHYWQGRQFQQPRRSVYSVCSSLRKSDS